MRIIRKLKGITFVTAIFVSISSIYSQVTIGKIEEPKTKEVVIKPAIYDSTKNLVEFSEGWVNQTETIDFNQYIGLKVYLPPDSIFDVPNCLAGKVVTNKYYTIIDICSEEGMDVVTRKRCNKKRWVGKTYVLRNDSIRDTVYWIYPISALILVPYFVKQKQLYEGKNLFWDPKNPRLPRLYNEGSDLYGKGNDKVQVTAGSKWKCTEVTLLQKKQYSYVCDHSAPPYMKHDCSSYYMYYILKNESNETLILNHIPDGFISEEAFIKKQQENKLQQEELIAQREAQREKEEKEENNRIADEKKAKEEHKIDCINKFGQTNGEVIAQGEVEIGMTTEMCKIAWGTPWDVEKTTTSAGTKKHWFYSYKFNLYFENDILVKIEH